MTTLEKISTFFGIAIVIFGAGAAWNSIDARIDKFDEKLAAIEEDKAEGLCLAIMSRQIVAIERGNDGVRDQLQALSSRHCPTIGPFTLDANVAGALIPMTTEELRLQREQQTREWFEAVQTLGYIDTELKSKPNRPSQ